MKYYRLVPRDIRDSTFILNDYPDARKGQTRLELKERYLQFACKGCGKVPINVIYSYEFDPNPKIRMRWDFNCTDDEVYFCNDRFLEFLKTEKISGCEPLQKVDSKWWILRFNQVYHCSEFRELHDECSVCGRPMETCGLPHWWHITLPSEGNSERAILISDLVCENRMGASGQLIASESVIQSMKAAKITGCEYVPVRTRRDVPE